MFLSILTLFAVNSYMHAQVAGSWVQGLCARTYLQPTIELHEQASHTVLVNKTFNTHDFDNVLLHSTSIQLHTSGAYAMNHRLHNDTCTAKIPITVKQSAVALYDI